MALKVAVLTVAVLTWSAIVSRASDSGVRKEQHPLHHSIDQLIAAAAPDFAERASPPSDDAEFVRRVYLDLTGRIPDSHQARDFIGNSAPDKRTRLIDQLLVSPEHVRHMQYVFDELLMGRQPEKHVPLSEWRGYLYESFRANKTWIQLTRELLTSDGTSGGNRAAARFLLDRELNTEGAAVPIGRIFLGRDLECAECHDHPEVGEYLQRHVFGIWAFLNRTYLFEDPASALTLLGERADGTVEFTSALTHVKNTTSPRILDLPAIEDPPLEDNPYQTEPSANVRGIPKYSRRSQLYSAIVSPDDKAFRLNIANRLWAMLLGRGLVEPVDMFHAANPASHPELLELLASDLLEHGYDMRRLIRAIALSSTYQRGSKRIASRELPPQQYYVALSKPLSPEQLAWSMMQATGVLDKTRLDVAESLNERQPGHDSTPEYDYQLEKASYEELQECVEAFVEAFAPGDEFSLFDDADRQDTFLKSGPLLTEWLQPTEGNLVSRLQNLESDSSIAAELYMAVFTRIPTKSETQAVADFLNEFGEDRVLGLQQLARKMLCSPEFRLNH